MNLSNAIVTDKLKKAEEKTEFIHEGKIYNIKKSNLLLRIDHKYFYDRSLRIGEDKYYSTLYLSEKGNYFLYIMHRNCHIEIDSLSKEQAKNWLLENDMTVYKEIFGDVEEA